MTAAEDRLYYWYSTVQPWFDVIQPFQFKITIQLTKDSKLNVMILALAMEIQVIELSFRLHREDASESDYVGSKTLCVRKKRDVGIGRNSTS